MRHVRVIEKTRTDNKTIETIDIFLQVKKIIITSAIIISVTIVAFVSYFIFNPPCLGLGCTGDYSFQDTATFTAPKSELEIVITSSGFVPDGADLGDGKGSVKMYSTNTKADTMYLKTSPENIDTIIYKGKTTPFSCSQMEKEKFYDFLVSVGYKQLDKNEISELRDAMTFINYGHKAGFYEGQTKYILVGDHKQHGSN